MEESFVVIKLIKRESHTEGGHNPEEEKHRLRKHT
jgi:hypothetical protein